MRKIIHVDMDAFYAAVEQRDNPSLRGRPVVVGGDPHGRGVVATASYEARRFGIGSAMAAARAYRLCPEAVFLRPRFAVYRQVSQQIHAILAEVNGSIEPVALDEAYLDVSHCQAQQGSATRIAAGLRARIHEVTGLRASAGVSYNKFLAKLASDDAKPDGLRVITPAEGADFVAALPVTAFHGIGKATAARLHGLGIHSGADLRDYPLARLQPHLGQLAWRFQQLAHGLDERPVQPHRQRKSISAETTFAEDLHDPTTMVLQLRSLATEVVAGLAKRGMTARTLTIKVRYSDFSLVTRSQSLGRAFNDAAAIDAWLPVLLARTAAHCRAVRLLGVGVSQLAAVADSRGEQLALF